MHTTTCTPHITPPHAHHHTRTHPRNSFFPTHTDLFFTQDPTHTDLFFPRECLHLSCPRVLWCSCSCTSSPLVCVCAVWCVFACVRMYESIDMFMCFFIGIFVFYCRVLFINTQRIGIWLWGAMFLNPGSLPSTVHEEQWKRLTNR